MLSIKAQQEIRKQTLRTLIQFGLLPDPTTGMYLQPPSNQEFLDMLQPEHSQQIQHTDPQMPSGTPFSDARQEARIIPLSILETDTTGLSNLIYKLGTVTEEVDTLISHLMRYREMLQELYGIVVGGIPGLSVVVNSDTDRGVDAQT